MLRLSKLPTAKGARAIMTFVLSAVVLLSAVIPGGYVLAKDVDLSVTVPCQAPGTPAMPVPANGATARPISLTLDWGDCDKAAIYHVYFGKEADPGYLASTADSSYTVTGLAYSTKYYWRIVAENDCGQTSGIVWSFTTRSRPGGGGFVPPEEPETPTEPEEPTEPETPTEPGEPSEPEVPTEPGEPEEPSEPGEQDLQLALLFWDMGKGPEQLWAIDDNGALLENAYGSSVGGTVGINIPQGTILKNPDGEILTMISVFREGRPPAPPHGYTVIEAFEFQPRGASFDPYITLTINFDAMLGRTDLLSDRPLIALYDSDTGGWTFLAGTVDYEKHEITFNVTHFSVFAIMAEVEPSIASSTSPRHNWILVAALWGAVLLLILLIVRRRRRIQAEPVEADTPQYYHDTHT